MHYIAPFTIIAAMVGFVAYRFMYARKHGWDAATPLEATFVSRVEARGIDREWKQVNPYVKE